MANRVAELREEVFRGQEIHANENAEIVDRKGRLVEKSEADDDLEQVRKDRKRYERDYRDRKGFPPKETSNLVGRTRREEHDMRRVQRHVDRKIGDRERDAKQRIKDETEDVLIGPDGEEIE